MIDRYGPFVDSPVGRMLFALFTEHDGMDQVSFDAIKYMLSARHDELQHRQDIEANVGVQDGRYFLKDYPERPRNPADLDEEPEEDNRTVIDYGFDEVDADGCGDPDDDNGCPNHEDEEEDTRVCSHPECANMQNVPGSLFLEICNGYIGKDVCCPCDCHAL
jgi:hypothetical protein